MDKNKKKGIVSLESAQENSILKIVNEIYSQGKFPCPIKEEIEKGEKVIGETNDYEKAIFLAREKIEKEFNQNSQSRETKNSENQIKALSHKVLSALLWATIRWRLRNVISADGIGLRQDWKVVSLSKKSLNKSRLERAIIEVHLDRF